MRRNRGIKSLKGYQEGDLVEDSPAGGNAYVKGDAKGDGNQHDHAPSAGHHPCILFLPKSHHSSFVSLRRIWLVIFFVIVAWKGWAIL